MPIKYAMKEKTGKVMEFFGKHMIFKTAYKCDRDRKQKRKKKGKSSLKSQESKYLFTLQIQWASTFGDMIYFNYLGGNRV